MIHHRLTLLAALLAALAFTQPDLAAAQGRFAAEDGVFTIALPSDFVRIPPLELFLFEHPGKQAPVPLEELAAFRKTRYGFQKKAETWFVPPMLIITLEQGKRRNPQELFMDHVLAERDSEAAAQGTEGHKFLEKEHLPLKRMHYYKETAYNAALGRKVVSGIYTYLTGQGFLRVAWFITEDQRAPYEAALHQAAMSVTISPEAAYKKENAQ